MPPILINRIGQINCARDRYFSNLFFNNLIPNRMYTMETIIMIQLGEKCKWVSKTVFMLSYSLSLDSVNSIAYPKRKVKDQTDTEYMAQS